MLSHKYQLVVAGVLALSALTALPAGAQIATVQGVLAPGVYGRIDIGNAPPPPLIYAQPIIIQRAPVYVVQQPLYLRVPPGHEKNWTKHCSKYNACGQPVYFVRDGERFVDRDRGYQHDDNDGGKKDKHKEKDNDKHNGKGRGNNDHDD